ncbi:ROK family protein [Rhodospirillaceae bacterium SYSU D60014]|uniref:ROK family protein n=1 Tax=Virgifigura deserti TaxID=2268457 RepID=UPI000E66FC8E
MRIAPPRIGIDLGGTKIEAIALDPAGKPLIRQRRATPVGDYDATVRAISELVHDVESALAPGMPPPAAHRATVGIGIPGTVSPASGLVKNANSTWLIGRPFDRDIAAALGRPVRIANDANCFALSEAIDGAGARAATVFGVIIGTGVGGGVAIDGRPLVGRNAIAGEWGHNPLPWPRDEERPGRACYCGREGCIETFLSGPALAEDFRLGSGQAMTAPEIVALANAGDSLAVAALARYEDRLARGLAAVINLLDPDVIVLGGGLSNIARLYESVPRLWGRHVFSDRVETRLLPPVHGDSSGVRGAAWLWPAEGAP